MYVLDTNTVIYFFKDLGQVAGRLFSHPPNQIAIPAVVVYELETGIAKSTQPEKRRAQLDKLLFTIRMLPFGGTEAKVTAHLRATLEKAGQPLGPIDFLIAGTTLAHQAILVTHNTREFSRVLGLKREDWY
jgi:tRNA(fMet)-specific endonuclease VapC